MYQQLGFLIIAILFCSCVSRPERSVMESIPKVYNDQNNIKFTNISNHWWKSFNKPELTKLIEKSFESNFTIQKAFYRLKQLNAISSGVDANLYPTVNFKSNASRTRSRTHVITAKNDRVYATAKNFAIGLTANYEFDLWGKLYSARKAELSNVIASEYDLQAAKLMISAQIAEKYFMLLEQNHLLNLQLEQLKTNELLYKLAIKRFKKATVTRLDILQRLQAINIIKKRIPRYNSKIENLKRDIRLLLGEDSQYELKLKDFELPKIADKPILGLPAQLLEQRPDIQSAWNKLTSADYSVNVSKANRLPTLAISSGIEYKSNKIEFLVNNWVGSIAAGVTAPIIDGGARSAEVEKKEAVASEKMLIYKETVLQAIKEVEDALTNEEKQTEYINALKNQIANAKNILSLTKRRYLLGQVDYVPVLLAISNLGDLNIELIQQEQIFISHRISLFKALGGAWEAKCKMTKDVPLAKNRYITD